MTRTRGVGYIPVSASPALKPDAQAKVKTTALTFARASGFDRIAARVVRNTVSYVTGPRYVTRGVPPLFQRISLARAMPGTAGGSLAPRRLAAVILSYTAL